jgi:hypothetical protein
MLCWSFHQVTFIPGAASLVLSAAVLDYFLAGRVRLFLELSRTESKPSDASDMHGHQILVSLIRDFTMP